MTTDLQNRKYQKVFSNFDANSDGQIDQTDVDMIIQTWCRQFDVEPSSPEWRQITSIANRMWQDLLGGTDPDGNKVVTEEEWIQSAQQADFIDKVCIPFGLAAFDLGDRDGDGKLSFEEMAKGTSAGGISAEETRDAFNRLDTDGDGYITKEEYSNALEDFYKSTDPDAPGNYLAGPF